MGIPGRALAVLASGLTFAALSFSSSGCIFLSPSHDEIPTEGERVRYPASSERLAGRELSGIWSTTGDPAAEIEAYMLVIPSRKTRAERLAAHAESLLNPPSEGAPRRIQILTINHPGFGEDQGRSSVRDAFAGAVDAYRFLRARKDRRPVYVYGFGIGAVAALHVAESTSDDPPAGLILNRVPQLSHLFLGKHGWWNLWLIAGPAVASLPRDANAKRTASQLASVPALFIVGSEDRTVPPRNSRKVHDAYAGPKRIVSVSGEHKAPPEGVAEGVSEALEWLWEGS
jgi:pimeloyl-ACP methyl ester carboxylesterase